MGYSRIDFPEKDYKIFDVGGPYSFEIPTYAYVEKNKSGPSEPWWINIVFPDLNGKIHISYKSVEDNLEKYIEDSRTLVYKHSSRSEGIEETPFIYEDERKFGILYDLRGDVASTVQFFVTDSSSHFLRGSLYFNTQPNRDSLNPVIDFLREDILRLIESTTWKL